MRRRHWHPNEIQKQDAIPMQGEVHLKNPFPQGGYRKRNAEPCGCSKALALACDHGNERRGG